jgi:hypothetical protein
MVLGSEIRDPGVKKHPIPDPGSATLIFTKWPNFVFSAAEFFGQSDWIILKRVCNTNPDGNCRII